MSFIKRLVSNKSNYKSSGNNNNNSMSDNNDYDDDMKRKFEKKLVMCQSDPEPTIDLSCCRLQSIGGNVMSTIRVYGKTKCMFDDNALTTFGCESLQSLSAIESLHLSYNRIHTIGNHIENLTHLKELYLSHNQLATLPQSFGHLTHLRILSLRDNRFQTFPAVVTDCLSLSVIDFGENQCTELPPSLLKLTSLKSLQLDCNPILVPSREICDSGVDDIMRALKQFFNIKDRDIGAAANDDICKPDNKRSDRDANEDTYQNYENYHNEKDQRKQTLIEWERSFQLNQINTSASKEDSKKKEMLSNIWKEQRLMSANISSIQLRKAKDKEAMLSAIVNLEQHSEQLIEKLNNWQERQRQQQEILEDAENLNLEMMLRYDHKVNLKRNTIIEAMQEMLNLETTRFALNDELKELNQLEIFAKINEKEQLQRNAFELLQRTRDFRHQAINNQILLVENELASLTQAEMQKKDDKLDSIINDIKVQRAKLAYMLSKLLAERRLREIQLREQLRKMEDRREQIGDENFWLVQYQYLLEQQPIRTQIQQFGIDERVGRVLEAVYEDTDNRRLVSYLPLFAHLTFDRLNSMADKDILHLGIEDFELCKLIRDKIDEECAAFGSNARSDTSPSAPQQIAIEEDLTPSTSSTSASIIFAPNEPVCDIKTWCQSECVVCLDQSSNVVFLPCGHVCTCVKCCAKITFCPLCRVVIDVQQVLH